ncbi:hypothetical protein QJS04_geneDACA023550 [Acorus gramineus]|uniref:Rhamnogalacturonan endolyase n=1 Tax=Acorus gramineus TaxID=55184 RepID=A0AAV9BQ95_ACOGR|nr:hypothetical protein QJS04_geneDACA023550 [Acorus gramineus]
MVFRLRRDKFHYMAISDKKQTVMPMPQDIVPPRGERLQLPESVWLRDPVIPDLKGEVDDKYMYSVDNKDGGLHGWISSGPPDPAVVGFWLVFPSTEFRSGGPTKQNLTNHTGPFCLAGRYYSQCSTARVPGNQLFIEMFHGTHYIGDDIVASFANGEAWRKVYGPVFAYLNSTRSVNNAYDLWLDAKEKRVEEEKAWPYDFVSSPFYLMSSERGSASGTLYIQDRFLSGSLIPASYAYVGLAASRTEGSWQTESKGYQFWTITDSKGAFTINNVIPGTYCVHGWVPGFVGDYIAEELVNISPGSPTQLGNLTYVSHRDGATVWEIGFPDRTAMGFYVPDPNPNYVNKLFINCPEKYRQYGLWDRKIAEKKYSPTTWQIKFNLNGITSGIYKLRLSVAASNHSDIQVRVNNPNSKRPLFEVANLGMDNTIGRHGIHGLYQLFSVDVPSALLIKGDNIVYLTQANAGNQFVGVLYDYIRLEAPASPGHSD